MTYTEIVNLVAWIIYTVFGVMMWHFVVFAVVGLFAKKKFPHTETKLKYGIIIPARNEETVVKNLIDSVYLNDYPQDKLHVFVIAHNCTDKTADVARAAGATVYEYNNPNECTMGYAFRYLFDRIEEDYGIQNYDGFFLFNADNVLDKQYFDKMNDAFVACDRKNVITSFRDSKNFGSNLMSAMYGLYFMYGCRFESRGRTVLGCSTRVQGTGYVVSSEVVKDGWKYVTLTEDWEFTADQVLLGRKIVYCDEATFYDEQPTSFRVMWRQRVRWSRGHLLVCLTRLGDLFRGLVKPKKKGGAEHKGSTYDIFINIMPVCVITTAAFVLQIIALCLCPLFGQNFWTEILSYLKGALKSGISAYLTIVLASIILYIVERKRIHNVSFGIKVATVFLWPFFLLLSTPAEIVSLFMKNLTWKTIPHADTTKFTDLNAAEGGEEKEAVLAGKAE